VQERRTVLEAQLAALRGYVSAGVSSVRVAVTGPRRGKRAKAKPKYQSKKTPSLKWSGRGMTPVWLRDEMKGTKLTKEDFAIA
jgi:DNA-binding protein H-NS